MRTIPAGEFKAKCLALMDEVQARGETIIITKRGKPVAQITPLDIAQAGNSAPKSIFGFMPGTGMVIGDIIGPIVDEKEWEHLKQIPEPSTSV